MQEQTQEQEVIKKPRKSRKETAIVSTVASAPVTTTYAETLLSQAITQGMPLEAIEKLMDLRERYQATEAKHAYDMALANFQADCPVIEKDKDVEFSGRKQYSYAPLDSIIRQVKGILAKHGFSYSFRVETVETGVKATCKLRHVQGHEESSEFIADLKGTNMMSNAQVSASKATFAKRYAFCNVTGIVTGDEDNDAGQSVAETKINTAATPEQRKEIDDLSKKAGMTVAEVAKRCREVYGISITEITQTQAMGMIDGLKKRITPQQQLV
jgi:hypothetical protein